MDPRLRAQLDEQIRYYRARAPEYEEWWRREGRYDRGDAHRAQWRREIAEVERALARAQPTGVVLELAAGTGVWTRRLAERAALVTAVDAAPEALARNRARTASPHVEYVEADLFTWRAVRRYDFAFFGFWLSHVPQALFEAFWAKLGEALVPGGRAFFVDNLDAAETLAHQGGDPVRGLARRELNDGRRFEIVKHYYEPDALGRRLASLGWRGEVRATERFFVWGSVSR